MCGLYQRRLQVNPGTGDSHGFRFPGRFVVARRQPRPTAQALGGAKFGHIDVYKRQVDISAQTYKPNCPPAALTKLPLITTPDMARRLVALLEAALAGEEAGA